jgi:uncharacterized protein
LTRRYSGWCVYGRRTPGERGVKIFLAGGTGFLGRYLVSVLRAEGHEITVLVRPGSRGVVMPLSVRIIRGDPAMKGPWQEDLAGHEVVINLAGASIFQPWTKKARKDIRESRLTSTENIVEAMGRSAGAAMHLFNASGVGYYGFSGDVTVDEGYPPGDTFLAEVARSWEEAALQARDRGARVVLCRLGIVLGRRGGAIPKILPLVRLRLGAAWGRGDQWFSWVHEKDGAAMFSFLLHHEEITGPVNFTSPMPVTNREMMAVMNSLLAKKPYIRTIPEWAIRSGLGEFSTVFLKGQRAIPGVLERSGFTFEFPSFREAAADLTSFEGTRVAPLAPSRGDVPFSQPCRRRRSR